MSAASNVQWLMFSGWCWVGDGGAGTELGRASATAHFGPLRGGGLMMTADLSTKLRHHTYLCRWNLVSLAGDYRQFN
jgi:hypothetical protein